MVHTCTPPGIMGVYPGAPLRCMASFFWARGYVFSPRKICDKNEYNKKSAMNHFLCGDIPLHRPCIGLIYGRYLQFRFLKWPLNYQVFFSSSLKLFP